MASDSAGNVKQTQHVWANAGTPITNLEQFCIAPPRSINASPWQMTAQMNFTQQAEVQVKYLKFEVLTCLVECVDR